MWLGGKATDAPAKTKKITTYICYTKPRVMKINKKEYGMGGSTMEMYKSGGMLKALLKDPKQREMAKAMLQEFENGGKVGEEDPAKAAEIAREIAATETVTAAVPTKQDLEEAYKMNFRTGATGQVSLEDFLKGGVDAGDLEKLKSAASALAEKRVGKERKAAGSTGSFEGRKVASGEVMGSSVRPGSDQGYADAIASSQAAADEATMEMLRQLGLK